MYLMTQSLLAAWQWLYKCPEGMEEDAKASFLQTLNREKTEQTEAMANGSRFEAEVYAQAEGLEREPIPGWEDGIRALAGILEGAPTQVKAKREIRVDGMDFLLYGILDAMKAGVIYDVKYLNKSMGSVELAGKYLDSPQHPAYLYLVPEAVEFRYLVSDGQDVYIEAYRREDVPYIGGIISQFIQSVTDMGLLDIYKEKWEAKLC